MSKKNHIKFYDALGTTKWKCELFKVYETSDETKKR